MTTLSLSQYKSLTGKKVRPARGVNKHSVEKSFIELALKSIGLPYEREYRFAPDRQYRADWCIPGHKILIEYEGLIYNSNRRGSTGASGHTTISGYVSNCEKYNLATVLGFRLLRYTAKTYKAIHTDLRLLINKKPPDQSEPRGWSGTGS